MGWKNVREHYGIEHIVKMVDGMLHIGSPYVGDLVVVSPEGVAEINRTFRDSAELQRYRDDIHADPATFRRLMAQPDVFSASIPVYTWRGGEILEKRCEEVGWPNATHDGDLMYDNAFFLDRGEALRHALSDARSLVERLEENVAEAEQTLARRRAMLDQAMVDEALLKMDAMGTAPARTGTTTD